MLAPQAVRLSVLARPLAHLVSLTILVVAVVAVIPGTSSASHRPDGLTSHWKLDENGGTTAFDSVSGAGHDNDGTISGATYSTSNKPPITGNVSSLSFDGSGVVTVPDSSSLDIASGDPMTLAFWVYYTSGTHIIGKRDLGCGGINYQVARIDGDVIHFNGSGGVVNAAASFTVGAWQHIAVTYDTSTLTIYKNGVNVGSAAYSFGGPTNEGPFTMGNVADCTDSLVGLMDDVRFYRAALTPGQVSDLANPPDLALSMSDRPDPVTVGGTIAYALQTANSGIGDASDAQLVLTLPTEVAFGSASPSQGSCSHDNGVVTCELGTVRVGNRARVYVNVTAVTAGSATAIATIASDEGVDDPDPNSDSAQTTTTINAAPNGGARTLTVQRTGRGSVTSQPPGISCGADCTEVFADGATVVLRARKRTGWAFAGWGGDCASAGTNPTCTLTMTADRTVTATFTAAT